MVPGSAASTRGKVAAPGVPAAREIEEVLAVGPPLSHVLPFSARPRGRARRARQPGHRPDRRSDGPSGLTTPLGRGRVVVLGVSDALTNRNLADGGGVLVARLLKRLRTARTGGSMSTTWGWASAIARAVSARARF